jgi:hypothetical protein
MTQCPTCGVKVPSVSELCWFGSCWGCHHEGRCRNPDTHGDRL